MSTSQDPASLSASFLDQCPVKNGFRLRGMEMTRIETFTDAAFAFHPLECLIEGMVGLFTRGAIPSGQAKITAALLAPPSPWVLPGFASMCMPVIMPAYRIIVGRRRHALEAKP